MEQHNTQVLFFQQIKDLHQMGGGGRVMFDKCSTSAILPYGARNARSTASSRCRPIWCSATSPPPRALAPKALAAACEDFSVVIPWYLG